MAQITKIDVLDRGAPQAPPPPAAPEPKAEEPAPAPPSPEHTKKD